MSDMPSLPSQLVYSPADGQLRKPDGAVLRQCVYQDTLDQALAARIAHRYNAHEGLVEAVRLLNRKFPSPSLAAWHEQTLSEEEQATVDAALAAAEGEG